MGPRKAPWDPKRCLRGPHAKSTAEREIFDEPFEYLGGGKVPGVPQKPIEKRGRQTTHFLYLKT